MRKGAPIEFVAEAFDEEGLGVGRSGGREVHVPALVPGDRAEVEITHESPHAARAWGRLLRVLEPSAERVAAACPNVGQCGGCLMQCAAYPLQLREKTARVAALLGGLGARVDTIVPSERILHYRNKAKLVAFAAKSGPVLGSYAPRTHEVIDMAGCQVTEPAIDPVARTLRDLLASHAVPIYDEKRARGELRYVILRANHEGRVLCVLVTAGATLHHAHPLASELCRRHPAVVGVVQNENPTRGNVLLGTRDRLLAGVGELADRIGEITLELSARAFFQINRGQTGKIYEAVRAACELTGSETVADVYSGVAGIALTLAGAARRVIAIEDNAAATADAARSIARAGASNVEVVTAPAATGLAALPHLDCVVLNPPRRGCDPEVLAAAARAGARRIVYVSCNPKTLARDLGVLTRHGFRARSVQPFDMLPHTPHIEVLAVLDRLNA